MIREKQLTGSWAALLLGIASIPLAFLGPLVVPALLMALAALLMGAWGKGRYQRDPVILSKRGFMRVVWAFRAGIAGTIASLTMWLLYAYGVLP